MIDTVEWMARMEMEPEPTHPYVSISGLVWIVCGLILLAAKVGFFPSSASIYWEYLGGFMILFGLVRLLWGLIRGGGKRKPGLWSGYI